jgi:hypothetical protein
MAGAGGFHHRLGCLETRRISEFVIHFAFPRISS